MGTRSAQVVHSYFLVNLGGRRVIEVELLIVISLSDLSGHRNTASLCAFTVTRTSCNVLVLRAAAQVNLTASLVVVLVVSRVQPNPTLVILLQPRTVVAPLDRVSGKNLFHTSNPPWSLIYAFTGSQRCLLVITQIYEFPSTGTWGSSRAIQRLSCGYFLTQPLH